MNLANIIDGEASVTAVAHAAMARTPDARLRQLVGAFVEHMHALVREVDLTEAEFSTFIQFVTDIGQQTNDRHNEVVLALDVLGISTLVALRNHPQTQGQSAAALLGPFWRAESPRCANGDSIARCDMPGAAMLVSGQVRDLQGRPVANAKVDVWQASPVGLYENQDQGQPEMNLRGHFLTDAEGRYSFRTVRPAGYPVPTGGVVGELLRLQLRGCMRPAHVHFMVTKPEFKTLITQVFADDCEHLENDVSFGVTRPLVGRFVRRADGDYTLNYDFVLERGESRIPEAPIK
ncbi:dioxygenase family protein [Pseudoduganella namucuonensis]|uniref:Catechol 1,2-dioxygenase n=1 Tax=Pseudoduganella namucuonensis TaxID=1035707 RepID=A0A1I7IHT4_9BURK|nr:dioxygenase [Pseudoduganella namucuonensis]SFU72481.1 catechol 1,2-dioxygenase [Pseudoduganella namucuonensis]